MRIPPVTRPAGERPDHPPYICFLTRVPPPRAPLSAPGGGLRSDSRNSPVMKNPGPAVPHSLFRDRHARGSQDIWSPPRPPDVFRWSAAAIDRRGSERDDHEDPSARQGKLGNGVPIGLRLADRGDLLIRARAAPRHRVPRRLYIQRLLRQGPGSRAPCDTARLGPPLGRYFHGRQRAHDHRPPGSLPARRPDLPPRSPRGQCRGGERCSLPAHQCWRAEGFRGEPSFRRYVP